ncbi:MAG: YgjV family protein [Clostridia bacterium]|nr:YgjV family protein [Clostridia bacterium]
MTPYEILAQAVGLVAMAFNILSYQQKSPKRVILYQLFGSSLFAVNFFLLGAIAGGITNLIAAGRAVVFANHQRFRAKHPAWLWLFIGLYVLSYPLTFTVFGKDFTLLTAVIELLPVIAMVATTVSFRMEDAAIIRRFGLVSSPCWLVYNITNLAISAIICEVLSLCSIVIGMLRHDRGHKQS